MDGIRSDSDPLLMHQLMVKAPAEYSAGVRKTGKNRERNDQGLSIISRRSRLLKGVKRLVKSLLRSADASPAPSILVLFQMGTFGGTTGLLRVIPLLAVS